MKHDPLLTKVTVPKMSKPLIPDICLWPITSYSVKPVLGAPASMASFADIPSISEILESVKISFQMSNNSQQQLPNTLYGKPQ